MERVSSETERDTEWEFESNIRPRGQKEESLFSARDEAKTLNSVNDAEEFSGFLATRVVSSSQRQRHGGIHSDKGSSCSSLSTFKWLQALNSVDIPRNHFLS